jgi:hypothetical protein
MSEIVSYDPDEPEVDPLQGYLAPPELPYAPPPPHLDSTLAAMRTRWRAQSETALRRADIGAWEQRIGIAALLAMVVGAVSSDIGIVVALALVAALASLLHIARGQRVTITVVLGCGLLAVAAAAYEIEDVLAAPDPVAVEWGLLVALAGAVALTSTAYVVRQRRD